MSQVISRRSLFAAAAAFLAAAAGGAIEAAAQSHQGGAGRGIGREGRSGGHETGDEHTHDSGDDQTHGEGGDDHDDKVDHGGKGKGPKYRGGRDVSQISSHGAGRSLEDRVLRKN